MAVNFAKLPEIAAAAAADKRGVTRLQSHISRQSAQCLLSPRLCCKTQVETTHER